MYTVNIFSHYSVKQDNLRKYATKQLTPRMWRFIFLFQSRHKKSKHKKKEKKKKRYSDSDDSENSSSEEDNVPSDRELLQK